MTVTNVKIYAPSVKIEDGGTDYFFKLNCERLVKTEAKMPAGCNARDCDEKGLYLNRPVCAKIQDTLQKHPSKFARKNGGIIVCCGDIRKDGDYINLEFDSDYRHGVLDGNTTYNILYDIYHGGNITCVEKNKLRDAFVKVTVNVVNDKDEIAEISEAQNDVEPLTKEQLSNVSKAALNADEVFKKINPNISLNNMYSAFYANRIAKIIAYWLVKEKDSSTYLYGFNCGNFKGRNRAFGLTAGTRNKSEYTSRDLQKKLRDNGKDTDDFYLGGISTKSEVAYKVISENLEFYANNAKFFNELLTVIGAMEDWVLRSALNSGSFQWDFNFRYSTTRFPTEVLYHPDSKGSCRNYCLTTSTLFTMSIWLMKYVQFNTRTGLFSWKKGINPETSFNHKFLEQVTEQLDGLYAKIPNQYQSKFEYSTTFKEVLNANETDLLGTLEVGNYGYVPPTPNNKEVPNTARRYMIV